MKVIYSERINQWIEVEIPDGDYSPEDLDIIGTEAAEVAIDVSGWDRIHVLESSVSEPIPFNDNRNHRSKL